MVVNLRLVRVAAFCSQNVANCVPLRPLATPARCPAAAPACGPFFPASDALPCTAGLASRDFWAGHAYLLLRALCLPRFRPALPCAERSRARTAAACVASAPARAAWGQARLAPRTAVGPRAVASRAAHGCRGLTAGLEQGALRRSSHERALVTCPLKSEHLHISPLQSLLLVALAGSSAASPTCPSGVGTSSCYVGTAIQAPPAGVGFCSCTCGTTAADATKIAGFQYATGNASAACTASVRGGAFGDLETR